ncbi:MAG: molybdenum cofactor guanylyltransferase [Spirochaetaceae bacterium]|nr:molybdenum cofactor guanylyltransferase [Spirochaetaceae bacterium]
MILAGGRGSRIGYDKKKLLLNGKIVIDSLIDKLCGIFDEIIVSSNNEFKHEYVTVLPDDVGAGPLAGIYRGLKRCKSGYLYVIACDMPFVSPAYIAFIRGKLEAASPQEYDACVARTGGDDGFLEPFNSFWGRSCIAPVRAALENGSYKILPVLKQLRLLAIENREARRFFDDAGGDLFFNINYTSDLQAAMAAKE